MDGNTNPYNRMARQEVQKQLIRDFDTQELVDHILVDCIIKSIDPQYKANVMLLPREWILTTALEITRKDPVVARRRRATTAATADAWMSIPKMAVVYDSTAPMQLAPMWHCLSGCYYYLFLIIDRIMNINSAKSFWSIISSNSIKPLTNFLSCQYQ